LPLILGGNIFGYSLDKYQTFELLDRAFDYGIVEIDTAGVYSSGISESIIGDWIIHRKRQDSLKIITKLEVDNRNTISDFQASLHLQFETSLSRLRSEVVDTLLLHHYPSDSKFLKTYLDFVEEKMSLHQIKRWGICNISPKAFSVLAEDMVCRKLPEVTIQYYCNWAKRDASYWSHFFSLVDGEDIILNAISYGVFGRGALVDMQIKDRRHEEFGKQRSFLNPIIRQEKSNFHLQVILREISRMTSEKENILERLALSFILHQRSKVLIGVRTVEQLGSILNAIQAPIDRDYVADVLSHISYLKAKLEIGLGDPGFGI